MDHRRDDDDQAGDVARRHRKRRSVVGLQPHAGLEVDHRVRDVQVRQHRALGLAGGARGVQDDGDIVLARAGGRSGALQGPAGERFGGQAQARRRRFDGIGNAFGPARRRTRWRMHRTARACRPGPAAARVRRSAPQRRPGAAARTARTRTRAAFNSNPACRWPISWTGTAWKSNARRPCAPRAGPMALPARAAVSPRPVRFAARDGCTFSAQRAGTSAAWSAAPSSARPA